MLLKSGCKDMLSENTSQISDAFFYYLCVKIAVVQYGRRQKNYLFYGGCQQNIPSAKASIKKYLPIVFLWRQDRNYRFERFGKVLFDENHRRNRERISRRSGVFTRIFGRISGTGTQTGRIENGQRHRSGRGSAHRGHCE